MTYLHIITNTTGQITVDSPKQRTLFSMIDKLYQWLRMRVGVKNVVLNTH